MELDGVQLRVVEGYATLEETLILCEKGRLHTRENALRFVQTVDLDSTFRIFLPFVFTTFVCAHHFRLRSSASA